VDQVIEFLNTELRPEASWSIKDEYPTVFQGINRGQIRLIADQSRIVSHAVIKYHLVKTAMGLFKAAGIGSVVTHSGYRNQGMGQSVLEDCIDTARSQGADFAILWSDLHEYYRRLGFQLAGREIGMDLVTRLAVPTPAGLRFEQGSNVEAEALLRVYNQHTVSTVRTAEDVRACLRIPKSHVYTAWRADNTLAAYAVEGKGADLEGHIHEWGGGLDNLLPLFNFMLDKQGRELRLLCSSQSTNLVGRLEQMGCRRFDGYLGLIKILNFPSLYGKIRKQAHAVGIQNLVMDHQDGLHYFGVGREIYKTDSDADMVRLIFGPEKAAQIHNFGPDVTRIFEEVFPLPMWLWGWDSI
jgi:GNAT superfamily N-acetyltransferase